MTAPTGAPEIMTTGPVVVVMDNDSDGRMRVDVSARVEVDGYPEPFLTWEISYAHAEALANALESLDAASELLSEPGSYGSAHHAGAVEGIRAALKVMEDAGLIFRSESGWYLQVRTCRVCGCTDLAACNPPCSWSQIDLCSRCPA